MASEPSTSKQSDNEDDATSMKFDVVGHLPLEIAQKILFQLSPEDLHSSASCCLSWNAALSCDFFWERLCRREGYGEVEEQNRSEFYTNLTKRYNCYWQGVYWYNHTLRRNWERNNYREVTYEIDDPEYHCSQWLYDDAFVYTIEDDTKLAAYYFNSKEINQHVFSLVGCFDSALSKYGKYLISLSNDKITVWNLENGSTIHHKHTGKDDFHVYKNLIVLTTWAEGFEVFNIETEQIEYCYSFEPGKMCLNMYFMDGRIIFTTTDDVIHILKWDDKSSVTLKCCNESEKTRVLQFMIKNDTLLCFCEKDVSDDSCNIFLCVWNITTVTKLHSTFLNYRLSDLSFMNDYLYFHNNCGLDGTVDIVLWDYIKKTVKAKLVCKRNIHPKISRSNNYVIIHRDLFALKIWCLSTRDYICDLNFLPHHFSYFNLKLSETRLTYAILPKESNHMKLYVRDFEI